MRSFCFCPNECNSLHWWAKQKEILYNLFQQLALESYGFADRSTEWEIRTPSSGKKRTTKYYNIYKKQKLFKIRPKIIENGFVTPKIIVYCNKLTKIILLLALESYGFADRSTEWEIRTPSSAQRDMKRQPRQL